MGGSAPSLQSGWDFVKQVSPIGMAYDAYKGNANPMGNFNPFKTIGNYMGWGSAQGGPIQGAVDTFKDMTNPLGGVNIPGVGGIMKPGGGVGGFLGNISNPYLSKIMGGGGQPQTQPQTQLQTQNQSLVSALMGGGPNAMTISNGNWTPPPGHNPMVFTGMSTPPNTSALKSAMGGWPGGSLPTDPNDPIYQIQGGPSTGTGGLAQPNPMGQIPFDSTFMDDFIPKNQPVTNTPMGNPLQSLGKAFGQSQPQPTAQAFTPPSGWSQAALAGTATTPETTSFPAMGTPAVGQAIPGGGLFTPEQMKAMFG